MTEEPTAPADDVNGRIPASDQITEHVTDAGKGGRVSGLRESPAQAEGNELGTQAGNAGDNTRLPATPTSEAGKPETPSVDPALIQKLQESGVKFTPGNVVAAGENADGQVVFLETGNSRAGLTHIIEQHGGQFAQMGIPEEQVPDFVVTAATEGKAVGIQGTRPIFEAEFDGQTRRVAVTVGSNGFVVGANPVGP